MKYTQLIISVLSGLAVCLPLVIKLVEYVAKAVREKNWSGLLALVMEYMAQAETMFDNGADRKKWVLEMIETSAKQMNYQVDIEVVSTMIDKLCAMSKVVNAAK